jgi:aminopeptidase N
LRARQPRAGLVVALAALPALVPLAAAAQGAPETLTVPGVSRELAIHRAATLSEIRYDLDFRIPADRQAPVHGTLQLYFQRYDDGPVVLDFVEPWRVGAVTIDGEPVAFETAAEHIVLPATALAPGPNSVRLEFVAGDGPLNRHDEFLYTLFVPARAREAFPAFDQPDLKARYRLRLTVPADWVAVANGAVVERREAAEHVAYRFAETEPLSTYLFSFAAGRFQVEETERDGRAMRMFHRETDGESVARNRAAIFDLHATALAGSKSTRGFRTRSGSSISLPSRRSSTTGWSTPGPSCTAPPASSWTRRLPATRSLAGPASSPTRPPTCGSGTWSPCAGSTTSG